MGQSFGSWTHGHGPMALGAWAAAARPPGRRRRAGGAGEGLGGGGGGAGPAAAAGRAAGRRRPMRPGPWAHAHVSRSQTGFLAYRFFSIPDFLAYLIFWHT